MVQAIGLIKDNLNGHPTAFSTDLYLRCILKVNMHSLQPFPSWLGGTKLYYMAATRSSCDLYLHKAHHTKFRAWFQFEIICTYLTWSREPLFQFYSWSILCTCLQPKYKHTCVHTESRERGYYTPQQISVFSTSDATVL